MGAHNGPNPVRSSVHIKESAVPAFRRRLFRTNHDYGLSTVPQQNAGGTSIYWPRGVVFFLTLEIVHLVFAEPSGGVFGNQHGC